MGDHCISRPEDLLGSELVTAPSGLVPIGEILTRAESDFEFFMHPTVKWENPQEFDDAFDKIAREQQDLHDAFENTAPD